jgi:hypothetical protein
MESGRGESVSFDERKNCNNQNMPLVIPSRCDQLAIKTDASGKATGVVLLQMKDLSL